MRWLFKRASLLALTSCIQYSLRHHGLALIWHSKYTSSPSLMSSEASVVPSISVTVGGSGRVDVGAINDNVGQSLSSNLFDTGASIFSRSVS